MAEPTAGPGSIRSVAELLDRLGSRRVFLVTGRASFVGCGARDGLADALAAREVVRFHEFSPNPTSDEVDRGTELFRAAGCDAVVAVGGGSVLDMAKLVVACSAAPDDSTSVIRGQAPVHDARVPFVAVPTTSGSGAEATPFAAVYVDGDKYSLAHPSMLPDHVVLDPELTASLPAYPTAFTGFDALAQAMESYWSVNSTEESRGYSRRAIELIRPSLTDAVRAPTPEARERMQRGAWYSGRAIAIAKTTAPHALSYAFTARYQVPHGHAVSLTLGGIFEHNESVTDGLVTDPRGVDFVRGRMAELRALLDIPRGEGAAEWTSRLMGELNLNGRLRDFGVSRADLPALAAAVNPVRLRNNPGRLEPSTIGRLLERLY